MTIRSLVAAAVLSLSAMTSAASAQTPIPVKLDLFDGDQYSHAFSEGLRAAISGDSRFQVSDTLPPDGLKISMDDALSYDASNGAETAAYSVNLKLGSGKFILTSSGFCDVMKFSMCGRVVAQDAYDAYNSYMAKRPGN